MKIIAYALNDYDWLTPRIEKIGEIEYRKTISVLNIDKEKIELRECFRSIDGEVVIYSKYVNSQVIMDVIMDN